MSGWRWRWSGMRSVGERRQGRRRRRRLLWLLGRCRVGRRLAWGIGWRLWRRRSSGSLALLLLLLLLLLRVGRRPGRRRGRCVGRRRRPRRLRLLRLEGDHVIGHAAVIRRWRAGRRTGRRAGRRRRRGVWRWWCIGRLGKLVANLAEQAGGHLEAAAVLLVG